MVDQKIDSEEVEATHAVENALSSLWEKAREASYLISTLRDEKKKLQLHIEELEEELASLRNDLLSKQSQLEEVRGELSTHSANGAMNISGEEKRELQRKIGMVISKLDQYLSP